MNGFGVDTLSISLVIRLSDEQFQAAMRVDQYLKGQRADLSPEDEQLGGLRIDYSALPIDGMWPASAKAASEGEGTIAVEFFKVFAERLGPNVDAMLLSAVASVVVV